MRVAIVLVLVGCASSDAILLISDDGDVKIGGRRCKKLADPRSKTFHGRWITLPEPVR
jgi:hypothetical protein